MRCLSQENKVFGVGIAAILLGALPVLAQQNHQPELLDVDLAPPVIAEPTLPAKTPLPVSTPAPVVSSPVVTPLANLPLPEKPGAGEIELQGIVRSVDAEAGRLTFSVTAFALPNGRALRVKTAKEKRVVLSAETALLDQFGNAATLQRVPVGAALTITGPDAGNGQDLAARCILAGWRIKENELVVAEAENDAKQDFTQPTYSQPAFSISKDSIKLCGRMSVFGGPNDTGVKADEGLALVNYVNYPAMSSYFLPYQPAGTTGLARRLNPETFYIACRWDYNKTPRWFLSRITVTVTNPRTGQSFQARPMDWGPHSRTNRVADLSPGLARQLGLQTDDTCIVQIPLPAA